MFWFGIITTAIWGCFLAYLFFSRSEEFWPLFQAAREDSQLLALNAIGDTLSGVFAPLAFLWLFVATWLQRRELQLQRTELSETRTVLAEQMKEMERSADESRAQTDIMKHTLQASQTKDGYDTFLIRLYYLCKFIENNINEYFYVFKEDGFGNTYETGMSLVKNAKLISRISQEDLSSIDDLLFAISSNMDEALTHARVRLVTEQRYVKQLPSFVNYITYVSKELAAILAVESYKTNPLVLARIKGTGLRKLRDDLTALASTLIQALRELETQNANVKAIHKN